MEKKQAGNEKKVWIKPQLVVYGDVEKLTTEAPIILTSSDLPAGG